MLLSDLVIVSSQQKLDFLDITCTRNWGSFNFLKRHLVHWDVFGENFLAM